MFKRVPNATIYRVWFDRSKPLHEHAAEMGVPDWWLRRRARSLGLPPRPCGVIPRQCSGITDLWDAGVRAADIAAHFGYSVWALYDRAAALGLPRRNLTKATAISIDEYLLLRSWDECRLANRP